jgi:hypothetical protein
MALELAPETESTVRRYAQEQRITVDELLTRAFPPKAEDEDPIFARLRELQREYGLPARPDGTTGHIPARELFAKWDAEDALRTPEQIEADQLLWEALENDRHPVEI